MRQRFKNAGLENFHDIEVLELLLYYVYPRRDTRKFAENMIREFGSLREVLDADTDTIMRKAKCTEKTATAISLITSIAKRYLQQKWENKILLDSVHVAGNYVSELFANVEEERFYMLCLNSQCGLINAVQVTMDIDGDIPAFVRSVLRVAIDLGATHVILAHNHIKGRNAATKKDLLITTSIGNILQSIGVSILDHIIVNGEKFSSMAENRYFKYVSGYDTGVGAHDKKLLNTIYGINTVDNMLNNKNDSKSELPQADYYEEDEDEDENETYENIGPSKFVVDPASKEEKGAIFGDA